MHGPKVLDVLAEKYPLAYFGGMVALSKVIRWEVGEAGAFDRSLTPDAVVIVKSEKLSQASARVRVQK